MLPGLLLVLALAGGASAASELTAPALQARVEAGDARAAWRLGLMARNGEGMQADPARALKLLTAAAEGGVPAAMFVLANMLAAGEGGTRDEAAARRWLEMAAALDYPEALQQLALTEPDPRKAELLMRQAAHAMTHRARD
jgi:TPR repeat protein